VDIDGKAKAAKSVNPKLRAATSGGKFSPNALVIMQIYPTSRQFEGGSSKVIGARRLVAGQTGVERTTSRKTVAECSIPQEWM
jgi:hypothetical protein